MDWWQGRQTNCFNGWLNKLNLNSYSSFHLLPDYWKKKEREKALQTWQQTALWSKPLLRWEHLNATLRGDCCLFQIKWFTNENTTHKITSITQSPLCRWFTAHMTDRGTCRFKCHPLSFFLFFSAQFSFDLSKWQGDVFEKQRMMRVKSLYWNYALLRLRHKRQICKGIKMLIKQAGCNSCFKPHEICIARYEPYAEEMAHWHATEREQGSFYALLTICM